MSNVDLGSDLRDEALKLFGEDSHMYSVALHGNAGELLNFLPHHIQELQQSERTDKADRIRALEAFGESLEAFRSVEVVPEPEFL